MTRADRSRPWLPDRQPTWADVAAAVLSAWLLVATLSGADGFSAAAAGLAFAATLLALGPVAQSRAGARVGRWFDEIALQGRALAILAFAALVVLARELAVYPALPVESVAAGVFLAVVVFVPVHALHARGVAGWRA